MADRADIPTLLTQMQDILARGGLAQSACQNGERLLRRLSSPVRVVLLGPDTDAKEKLHDMLAARPIAETSLTVVPHKGDVPFAQADICLWCTADFGDAEATQWQSAPDRLKDHSFLVPLATGDTAQTLFTDAGLDALGDIAAEEFHSMFPILLGSDDTTQSGTFDALLGEISRLVRSGRAADRDNAELFVQTFQPAPAASSKLADQADSEISTAVPAKPVPQPSAAPQASNIAPISVYRNAFGHICERAADLPNPVSAETDMEQVLSICQETSEAVAEMFSDHRSDDPDFLRVQEDVLCAADKLLLMSLETGVAPAVAAVTTLLQTRREMEARMAP